MHHGHRGDTKPLADIVDPASYDAMVLGAPINGMRPVPELLAFIAANATVSYLFGKAARGFSALMEKATSKAAVAMGATLSTILPGRRTAPTPTLMRIVFGIPKDLPLDRINPAGMKAWAEPVVGILPR